MAIVSPGPRPRAKHQVSLHKDVGNTIFLDLNDEQLDLPKCHLAIV